MKKMSLLVAIALLTFISTLNADPEALAKETEEYCKSTADSDGVTNEALIAKIDEACKLLESEGQAAFPKFKGKGSNFIFEGTYIWIHKLDDVTMLMHPIKYKLEGKQLANLKDKNGKRLFVAMNAVCNEKGSGWVEYLWPMPGTKDFVRKISYVKKCTMPDGTNVVVGGGLYNYTDEQIASLEIN